MDEEIRNSLKGVLISKAQESRGVVDAIRKKRARRGAVEKTTRGREEDNKIIEDLVLSEEFFPQRITTASARKEIRELATEMLSLIPKTGMAGEVNELATRIKTIVRNTAFTNSFRQDVRNLVKDMEEFVAPVGKAPKFPTLRKTLQEISVLVGDPKPYPDGRTAASRGSTRSRSLAPGRERPTPRDADTNESTPPDIGEVQEETKEQDGDGDDGADGDADTDDVMQALSDALFGKQ